MVIVVAMVVAVVVVVSLFYRGDCCCDCQCSLFAAAGWFCASRQSCTRPAWWRLQWSGASATLWNLADSMSSVVRLMLFYVFILNVISNIFQRLFAPYHMLVSTFGLKPALWMCEEGGRLRRRGGRRRRRRHTKIWQSQHTQWETCLAPSHLILSPIHFNWGVQKQCSSFIRSCCGNGGW